MLKKVLSFTLVITMVISMFCGCATQTAKVSETTATTVKEIANEPVTNVKNENALVKNAKLDPKLYTENIKSDEQIIKEDIEAHEKYIYGTNEKITGDYDKSLAVKCSKGTYVGSLDEGVLSFKGIRYAEPPVGKLRWHEPIEVPDSDEVFEAKYYSNACPQRPGLPTPISEDCLMLNIWTDPNTISEKKPVMVWFHGGAFVAEAAGDYLYHGHNFGVAHKDEVVLVTVEYRIGVLGFVQLEELFGEEYKNSNNLGLLDQIEALKWIQKNIVAFGGDPDQVTIFGESAGAGCTSLLPISPKAQGLFKRAISQSGAAGLSFSREYMLENTKKWIESENCKTIDDLLALPAEKLPDVFQVAPTYQSEVLPYDGYEEIFEAWKTGFGKDIDLLLGTNKDEMSYFVAEMKDPYVFMLHELGYQEKRRSFIAEVDKWRFDKLMEIKENNNMTTPLLRMTNDLIFHVEAFSEAIKHGETTGKGKTFLYHSITPSHRDPAEYNGFELGACHASEVSYIFNNTHWPEVSGFNQDKKYAEVLQKMWINFAKTGDPSTDEYKWPEFTKENWNVMILDDGGNGGIRIDNNVLKEEMELALPLGKYRTIESGL